MLRRLLRCYVWAVQVLAAPIMLREYLNRRTGAQYNIGIIKKVDLIFRMRRNNKRIVSASNFMEHLIMATKILNVPKSVEGCVIECGSYKGVSTANLSLVCALCNRRLEVFDSFEGLPDPSGADKAHYYMNLNQVHTYSKGAFKGSLEEVRGNISRHGEINVCRFNVGYFRDTLPKFKSDCVFVFCDVDLRDSLETCIKYIWPLLQNGCYFFTHEAPHFEIGSLFFDRGWWRENLRANPPGLIGAGNGLGLFPESGGFTSPLGYVIKNSETLDSDEIPQN